MSEISNLLNLVWDLTHPDGKRIWNGIRQILVLRGGRMAWVPLAELTFDELLARLPGTVRARILNAIQEARSENDRSCPNPGQGLSGRPRPRRPR